MFYRVGDIDLRPVDTSLIQCTIKHLACRSDKGLTREIFLIAGLLANKHYLRVLWPFAKHSLSGILPERAGAAIGSFCAKRWDIVAGCSFANWWLLPFVQALFTHRIFALKLN